MNGPEFNSMPRKIRQVVGPTHSSGDRGMPISVAAWSIAFKRVAHISVAGGSQSKIIVKVCSAVFKSNC